MKSIMVFLVIMAAALIGVFSGHVEAAALLGAMAFGTFRVMDAALRSTVALPSGASATTGNGIDLGHDPTRTVPGQLVAEFELLIEVPAVTTGMLGDAATIKYDVVTSANSDLSSPTVVAKEVIVQTGAGGAGAAANSVRFRLPTNCQRYVGLKSTKSASGDASSVSATMTAGF